MEKSPSSFHKIKPILFVAFLATIAVVYYRVDYGKKTIGSLGQKQTATITDQSTLFPFREQTINYNSSSSASLTEQMNVSQNQSGLVPVVSVIDGDTIVAEINGQSVHVRLIGINSPELNDKRPQVACLAQKAKEEAEKLLNGQKVYLEKDSAQGDYDKYNRLLAYVFLPTDSTSLPSTQFGTGTTSSANFNKLMIEEGYAYEYTYRLPAQAGMPYKYQSEFKAAQSKARADKKGLWSSNTCRN